MEKEEEEETRAGNERYAPRTWTAFIFTRATTNMMLGVEGYGSDSDGSDDESVQQQQTSNLPATALPSKSSLLSKLPPPKKSGFSLPPPTGSGSAKASSSKSSTGLSPPAPKKKAPKKITIGLPSLSAASEDADDLDDRPMKKARVDAGAGASALLSMLPAPKNKNPILPQAERVLGGGRGRGLVFHAKQSTQVTVEEVEELEDEDTPANVAPVSNSILEEVTASEPTPKPKPSTTDSALPFRPTHVARGKANVSTEENYRLPKSAAAATKPAAPAIDFFSLGALQYFSQGSDTDC